MKVYGEGVQPGVAIKALGYVGIETTSVEKWKHFATEVVGMMAAPGMPSDDALYLKMDEYPWRLRIGAGDCDRLAFAGWEVADAGALQGLRERLDRAGIAFSEGGATDAESRNVREFIRLRDPSGLSLEVFHSMALDYARLHSPAGVRSFVTGYHGDMGLGHFVIPTDRFAQTHAFYREVLGFGQTDYMHFRFSAEPGDGGQGLHFLHVDNPRHHSLALFQDPAPPPGGCVHLMVEVEDIDEVGYFIDRCKAHGVPIVSSLGRHTNDRMISVYAQSPSGFALEFGCAGVQLDWNSYKPTESRTPSLWGHDWAGGRQER